MKKLSSIIWGVVLIAAGVLFALNALEITNVDVFFDGWWTLFIIIPCTVELFTEREKTGNLIGLAIGIFLLLGCQDVIGFGLVWKLMIPTVIVIIGLNLVFGGLFRNKANDILSKMKGNGNDPKGCCAAFSGTDLKYDGEVFDGAELTAVFGGIKCDLRNAIFEKDCAIKASAIFGGIDILVPAHVNIKINSTSVFGGVGNKTSNQQSNSVTLYIDGSCVFGGIDVK